MQVSYFSPCYIAVHGSAHVMSVQDNSLMCDLLGCQWKIWFICRRWPEYSSCGFNSAGSLNKSYYWTCKECKITKNLGFSQLFFIQTLTPKDFLDSFSYCGCMEVLREYRYLLTDPVPRYWLAFQCTQLCTHRHLWPNSHFDIILAGTFCLSAYSLHM